MPFEYSEASRHLQDRFDTRRLADRLTEVTVHPEFTEADRAFIHAQDLVFEPTVAAGYPECQFVVRVRATAIYPNCPRYIHQYRLIARSPFVPRTGVVTPTPDWKRSDWACDVLAANDPARR